MPAITAAAAGSGDGLVAALGEDEGHGQEPGDQHEGDRPQALLDEVGPDVAQRGHRRPPLVSPMAAVGAAGAELPPVDAGAPPPVASVEPAGPCAVAPAVRPWPGGST